MNSPNWIKLMQLEILQCAWTRIPESVSALSRLQELIIIDCSELQSLPQLPSGLCCLQLSGLHSLERLPDLSYLTSLLRFCLLNCSWVMAIPGLKDMVPLKTVSIGSPLTNLNGLECLPPSSYLWLEGCKFERLSNMSQLKGIHVLTVLAMLEILHISGCVAIEMLPNLSLLCKLKQLKLHCCG